MSHAYPEVMTDVKEWPAHRRARRQIAGWLLLCCAMIFAMVVLGGVTRLTGSGLSMVEWDPIFGVVPPLTQARWEEVFHQYQQSPEYKKINAAMDLQGFKGIYWLEYAHRLLGRTIGVVFLLPLLYFWMRGKLERALAPKLLMIFVLGGLQGALGWYMVKSGLIDNPHVSQYRLTAHLAMAFVIYAYIFWVAMGLLYPELPSSKDGELRPLKRFASMVAVLISLTVLSGGFVAGLKAGLAYNTFPTMNGRWVPGGLLELQPLYRNFFENITTVQFDHRVLATLVVAAVVAFWLMARRFEIPTQARGAIHLLLAMVAVQVSLGVSTLLLYVPVPLAAAHQTGALTLFTSALFVSHRLRHAQV